jgi:hypothetical protein
MRRRPRRRRKKPSRKFSGIEMVTYMKYEITEVTEKSAKY